MPKKAVYPVRNHPDMLALLCRRYGSIVLEAVAKGNTGARFDSLKIKLIAFYTREGLEFSREKEKKEFSGHNLQSLKYDATRLFIRVAAKEIAWGNKDLFTLLGEVNWSLENQAYPSVLEICLAAKSLAVEREEFQFALQILEIERETLDRIGVFSGLKELKKANLEATLTCASLLGQISNIRLLKQTYFDPIKEFWDRNEIVPVEMIHKLESAINSCDPLTLDSETARMEYLSLVIPFHLHKSDTIAAEKHMRTLLNIYERSSCLISKHPLRHISHMRAACLLFVDLKHFQEAKRLLEGFLDTCYPDKGFELDAKYSWLRCAAILALISEDQELRLKSLQELESYDDELWEHVGEKSTIVVLWISMLNYIEENNWRKANSIGSRILLMKSKMKIDILVNVRVAMFACEISLFRDDFQRIEASFDAIQKFIFRNRQSFPRAGKILKAFYKLWLDYSKRTIDDHSLDRIIETLNGNTFASESRNSGYFDFKKLLSKVATLLKTHQ